MCVARRGVHSLCIWVFETEIEHAFYMVRIYCKSLLFLFENWSIFSFP